MTHGHRGAAKACRAKVSLSLGERDQPLTLCRSQRYGSFCQFVTMVHMEADMLEIEPEREEEREDENIDLTQEALDEILGSQNVENVDASKISHLNLDRQRIGRVPHSVLSGFKSVTNLYLQHNSIETLDFCSEVRRCLRFLASGALKSCANSIRFFASARSASFSLRVAQQIEERGRLAGIASFAGARRVLQSDRVGRRERPAFLAAVHIVER